jgi:hypothetical protein
MSGYYAYFIGDDGHITNRVAFFAVTDEEAKERAKRLVERHRAMAGRPQGRDIRSRAVGLPQAASCPAYIRILPGVVIRSLPDISTM